jgi:hypothetical protein
MKDILSAFLSGNEAEVELDDFKTFHSYYDRTFNAVKQGTPAEAEVMGPVNQQHIQAIVELISQESANGQQCYLIDLQQKISQNPGFSLHSYESINRTIDLTLRLWLVLNIRDEEYTPGVYSVRWDDQTSLQTFIKRQFPKPRRSRDLSEKMFDLVLPDSFTMVKLERYSGIKVEWTYHFGEHLDLDNYHRILKVFPLKFYMHSLRKRLAAS